MKKIGFIDYFLDEWHANMYPGWIRAAAKDAWDVALAWEAVAKPDGMAVDKWCQKHKVNRAASIAQIVAECDAIIVLSPDNMEQHEALADLPLRSGKPVYIDKTFAPTLAAGRRMFAKAAKYGTPMWSSSALRFSPDLRELCATAGRATPRLVVSRGVHNFSKQYAVHAAETLVMLLGTGAQRVMQVGTAATPVIAIDYGDDRRGVLEFNTPGFQLFTEADDGTGVVTSITQDFWNGDNGFIPNLLKFFDTGRPPAPQAETLEVAALLEAAHKAATRPHKWIAVPGRNAPKF